MTAAEQTAKDEAASAMLAALVWVEDVAAEKARLHHARTLKAAFNRLNATNAELLAALKEALPLISTAGVRGSLAYRKITAAIAQAEAAGLKAEG